jgi:hypothetical protein
MGLTTKRPTITRRAFRFIGGGGVYQIGSLNKVVPMDRGEGFQ